MDEKYALEVAIGVAARTGWTVDQARKVVGDTSEYEEESMTPAEAVAATIDAIRASA